MVAGGHTAVVAHLPADLALDRDKPAESRRDGRKKEPEKECICRRQEKKKIVEK